MEKLRRGVCFNLVRGKEARWAKGFPINVNEGLSQKEFFPSFQPGRQRSSANVKRRRTASKIRLDKIDKVR